MNPEIVKNPYPGLRAFEYAENYLFFGREGRAQEVAGRLQDNHFVAVVGSSGSGKSSLVRAGLLPLLCGGMMSEAGSHWRIAVMRPEETPIRNLAQALTYPTELEIEEISGNGEGTQPRQDETQIGITEAILRRSGVGLLDFYKSANFDEDENLLVVVDQFEELFRFKQRVRYDYSDEAAAFVKLLLEATADKRNRIYVVMTMRSDFLGDCAEFRGLPEAINDGQYLIPRLTRDQLRLIIESPARVCDAVVSPILVNRLLNDLENDQNQTADARERMLRDSLPVLQHALMRTWDEWLKLGKPDEPIDISHYENEKIGGMTHALSRHAEEAFNELSDEHKLIAEKMFKCLTDTDSENRETRRPSDVNEICSVTGAVEEEIFKIIEVFRREGRTFLMPPPYVPLRAETKIDISHESLIRNWETLKVWVKNESEDAWQYRRISENASLYNQEEGSLWSGRALAIALEWRENFNPTLAWASRYQIISDEEKAELANLGSSSRAEEEQKREEILAVRFAEAMAFLDTSAKAEAEELAERERIRQQRIRTLAVASAILAVFLLIAGISALYAFRQNGLLKDAEKELTRRNEVLNSQQEQLEKNNKALEDARKNLQIQNEDLIKAREELEKTNEELKRQINNVKEQKKIADIKTQDAEQEKKRAEAAATTAEEEKKRAEEQSQLAQKAEQRAYEERDNARKISENLDKEKKRIKLNLDGLFALENFENDKAEELFKNLMGEYKDDPRGKEKLKYDWWANYNISKIKQQQYKYDDTEKSFNAALDVIKAYENTGAKNINSIQFSEGYFMNASYKSPPVADSDIDAYKTITLRRFAQFYRICAVTRERCSGIGNSTFSQGYKSSLDLNKDAVKQYEELLEISKVKDPQTIEDKIYRADVLKESADVYRDLKDFEKVKTNYRNAAGIYEEHNPSASILVMKNLLDAVLQEAVNAVQEAVKNRKTEFREARFKTRDASLKEADEIVVQIVDKTADLLVKENPNDTNIVYNKTIGDTYVKLAEIYNDQIPSEEFQRIKTDYSKYSDDREFNELLKSWSEYSTPVIPDNLTSQQQAVVNDLMEYTTIISVLRKKSNILSPIGNSILDISDKSADDLFSQKTLLAAQYVKNKECEKALKIISELEANSKISAGDLEEIAMFYENSVHDYKKARKYYEEWDRADKSALDSWSLERTSIYVGKFFLQRGDYDKAYSIFTKSLNESLKNPKDFRSETEMLFIRTLYEILFEQAHERIEGKDKPKKEELIKTYEKMLGEIQIWGKNQKALKTLANSNAQTTNPNAALTDTDYMIFKQVHLIFDVYLRVRLAALYFDKGKIVEAEKFLKENIGINFADSRREILPLFVLEGYISSLKEIVKHQKDPAMSIRYYQFVVESLENFGGKFGMSEGMEKYVRDNEFTKEYYDEYIRVLEDLQKVQGENVEMKNKIAKAKIKKEKAKPVAEFEKSLCVDVQNN